MDRLAALTKLLGGEHQLPKPVTQPAPATTSNQKPANAAKAELVDAFGNLRINPVELPTVNSILEYDQARNGAAGTVRNGATSAVGL